MYRNASLKVRLAIIAMVACGFGCTASLSAQDRLTITTWNIENLGGAGRGFAGGFGRGSLDPRTPAQLEEIAELIRDDLGSDILAIQEISITSIEDGVSICAPLDTIRDELGDGWEYFIPEVDDIPEGHANLFCGFLWNGNRVNCLHVFAMSPPNPDLAGANLFDRVPVAAYFEAINGLNGTNDFVVINVHLKSGQGHDENHLIAITVLEHRLTRALQDREITETDRIILGDFNDNPYATTASGNPRFSSAMYEHMAFKKYVDLVTEDFHATRMNTNLTSVIDHILVNVSAKNHIPTDKAVIFLPGPSSTFATWRQTFSDHFPISFELTIASADDDVDF